MNTHTYLVGVLSCSLLVMSSAADPRHDWQLRRQPHDYGHHHPPGPGLELDLSNLPATITEPGHYIVRRDWDLGDGPGLGPVLTIAADDVDIDFRGHRIRFTSAGTGFDIAGNGVSIHDGTLDSDLESTAIVAHGVDLRIEDMSIYSYQGLSLGERVVVRNSSLRGRFVLINGGDDVLVENSEMSCAFSCVQIGNRGTLRGNTIDGFGDYVVIAKGDDNTIESNLIDANGPDAFVIDVRGNHNLIARNTVREPDGNLGILIRIGGTANVVDSTIVLPPGPDFPPANVGIQFLRDGNYYGNNRIGTLVPFDLGGTTQTDWGGNVGY